MFHKTHLDKMLKTLRDTLQRLLTFFMFLKYFLKANVCSLHEPCNHVIVILCELSRKQVTSLLISKPVCMNAKV